MLRYTAKTCCYWSDISHAAPPQDPLASTFSKTMPLEGRTTTSTKVSGAKPRHYSVWQAKLEISLRAYTYIYISMSRAIVFC
jgi:hypothetical protein